MECCGDDAGPKSWYKSTFNDYDFQGEELGQATTTNKDYYDIPDSCCRWDQLLMRICICRFHDFEMFRQRGSIECSNNVHIPKQQTPSKQALWEVGCVEKLTNIINSNIFYILGGIAAVAFMGK